MTVNEWLDKVTASDANMKHWLTRQYIGEVTASHRIEGLCEHEDLSNKWTVVLNKIAGDEAQHAAWIKQLLVNRGYEVPEVSIIDAEKRYWKPVFDNVRNLDEMLAAGAHAEEMRLKRIVALSASDKAGTDIRDTFRKIRIDEEWHAAAFKMMASTSAYDYMSQYHEAGLDALGLEI